MKLRIFEVNSAGPGAENGSSTGAKTIPVAGTGMGAGAGAGSGAATGAGDIPPSPTRPVAIPKGDGHVVLLDGQKGKSAYVTFERKIIFFIWGKIIFPGK